MPQRRKEPHVTKGNILDDLGFEPEVSFQLKVKSELHIAILKLIRKRGYNPTELAHVLGIPQPRVSELMRGKLSTLSLDKLAEYADRLDSDPSVKVSLKDKQAA